MLALKNQMTLANLQLSPIHRCHLKLVLLTLLPSFQNLMYSLTYFKSWVIYDKMKLQGGQRDVHPTLICAFMISEYKLTPNYEFIDREE